MAVCLQLAAEQRRRSWSEQVLPYGLAEMLLITPSNWTLTGNTSVASGSPAELGLSISGQDAGNRLLGTYSAGNLSGQSPRFLI